jgi:hypothetical protein
MDKDCPNTLSENPKSLVSGLGTLVKTHGLFWLPENRARKIWDSVKNFGVEATAGLTSLLVTRGKLMELYLLSSSSSRSEVDLVSSVSEEDNILIQFEVFQLIESKHSALQI